MAVMQTVLLSLLLVHCVIARESSQQPTITIRPTTPKTVGDQPKSSQIKKRNQVLTCAPGYAVTDVRFKSDDTGYKIYEVQCASYAKPDTAVSTILSVSKMERCY